MQSVNRYYNPTVKALVKQLQFAQDNLEVLKLNLLQRQLEKFDADFNEWQAAVSALTALKC